MKSLVELPDPVAQSKQFVYMSQSIFEKSTAAFGIKEGFASSCAKSSALPSWPAMCVTQLQATAAFPNSPEQTKAADAVLLHVKLSGPGGKATPAVHRDVQEVATLNAGLAISWQGSVLLLHPGASLAQHVPAGHSALAGALPRAAHEPAKGSIRILRLQGANLRPNLASINH